MPRARKGGNSFDLKRADIRWRSSALALAAGMDEWPDDVQLPRDLMERVIAQTIATTNIANAKDADVVVPAFVGDVVATIHD